MVSNKFNVAFRSMVQFTLIGWFLRNLRKSGFFRVRY